MNLRDEAMLMLDKRGAKLNSTFSSQIQKALRPEFRKLVAAVKREG